MKKLNVILACALSAATVSALCACSDSKQAKKYTVVFDTSGGTAVSSYSLEAGASISRPKTIPEKDKFYFSDWYVDSQCTVKFDFANTKMPKENITVYAGWLGQSSVTVTYDANGGYFSDDVISYVDAGVVGTSMSAPAADPTNFGYEFGGWCTDAAGVHSFTFGTYPYDSITLYAKWNKSADYAYVTYYGNGSVIKTVPVKKGTAITAPTLFGDDIEVSDWYTDAELRNKYTFGADATADVDLYSAYYTKGLTVQNGVVIGYTGTSDKVYVPHMYAGKPVTSVGEYAFYRSGESDRITKIILPDSIVTLQKGAFYECRYLTDVNLSDKITVIPDEAFWNNERLKAVGDISKVTSIGAAAFAGCKAIRTIELPATLRSIGESAFAGCATISDITIPTLVTAIPDDAFNGCSLLETVTVETRTLTGIGARAFEFCESLTSVYLQSLTVANFTGVTSTYYYSPFYGCDSVSIYVQPSLVDAYKTSYGSLDNRDLADKFKPIG